MAEKVFFKEFCNDRNKECPYLDDTWHVKHSNYRERFCKKYQKQVFWVDVTDEQELEFWGFVVNESARFTNGLHIEIKRCSECVEETLKADAAIKAGEYYDRTSAK